MLSAGLHHLAGRFDFDAVTAALAERGVPMMHPFSEFAYLRQAFTRGERWPVAVERLERLVAAGRITPNQRERFAPRGSSAAIWKTSNAARGSRGSTSRW